MCKLKSGIILKDRIFVPDYDSHSSMLDELKIEDTRQNAERLFVRAELIPPNNDVFSDISTWTFHVDQDIVPDWFVAEVDKERMIEAVKAWAKSHIYVDVNGLTIEGGQNYYLKNCKDVRCKNSTVTARGNSTVTAWGNSTVTAWENSTVTAWENSTVTAWENSTVTAWENSTVTARGNSTVIKDYWSSFNTDNLLLCDNATFKDCGAEIVYQSGNYKLVTVSDGKIKRRSNNGIFTR